jgi:gamma-glutamyltranspeptidase/glutathione hydrolase
VQPALAATLASIAELGEAALRAGPVVEELLAASSAGGGILAAADFRDYRPESRPVHRFAWGGVELLCATPPSSGALFLHQTLRVLEGWPLAAWGRDDPRTALLLAEASAAAFADRNALLGDPASMRAGFAHLVGAERIAARRAALGAERATPPAAAAPEREARQTTHFSVVDGSGAAVACTTTLNGAYGAKVMAPGGFLLNNEMDDFAAAPGAANQFGLIQGSANAIVPGRRPLSSMSPTIVTREGRVDAVLGSPGGPTILSAVLHVLLDRYLFGLDPAAAVAAPRAHRQDWPADLSCEPGYLSAAAAARLRELGQPLKEAARIGEINAIFRGADGWIAVADPRGSGGGILVPSSGGK